VEILRQKLEQRQHRYMEKYGTADWEPAREMDRKEPPPRFVEPQGMGDKERLVEISQQSRLRLEEAQEIADQWLLTPEAQLQQRQRLLERLRSAVEQMVSFSSRPAGGSSMTRGSSWIKWNGNKARKKRRDCRQSHGTRAFVRCERRFSVWSRRRWSGSGRSRSWSIDGSDNCSKATSSSDSSSIGPSGGGALARRRSSLG
jgi:hypothetical protein